MQKLIYVENDYDGMYGRYWSHLGEITTDRNRFLSEPEAFDLVCFTGGEDVSPELYGHRNLGSHCRLARDKREVVIFEMAAKHEIPMTGICRGSQFLNVMCGGTMVQHLNKGHGGPRHAMLIGNGRPMEVTSSHHQMSVLGPNGVYLGWSAEPLHIKDCVYDGELEPRMLAGAGSGDDSQEFSVTEAFAYPKLHIFASQHHPEWQNIDEKAAQWTLQMTRRFCWEQENLTIETS